MNTFVEALEKQYNYKFTENGAIAYRSTGSKVYDLFAFGAAYRNRSDSDCIFLFKQAYEEDPDLALKCLFYIRDCRGGQGERRFFRVCFKWLAENHFMAAARNIDKISEFGRWDDLFILLDTELKSLTCQIICTQLSLDILDTIENKGISLLAKWMPSENAHSVETARKAKIIREYLGMTPKQYRQMLSRLRKHLNVLERLMSANEWDKIDFSKIPSKAGLIYRNAFARRDLIAEKYKEFIQNKDTKVNAATLYPYEIVERVIRAYYDNPWYGWKKEDNIDETERAALNKYWGNQVDYLNGESPKMLCVIDTSGSMRGRPINVAISLGLYCAERMTGPFAGKYISFSRNPRLINTEGIDFVDKVERIYDTNLCENTDLPKVFKLLLNTAFKSGVKIEDMPETIVVISDMEIDAMTYGGNRWTASSASTEMEKIREEWARYGLELPRLIYWNVDARNNTILDSGPNVSFVSGCSPAIFEMVLTGKNGFDLMLDVLLKERYACIKP